MFSYEFAQTFNSLGNCNQMVIFIVLIAISDQIFKFADFIQVGFTVTTSIRTGHSYILFDFMSFYPAISIDIQKLAVIMMLKTQNKNILKSKFQRWKIFCQNNLKILIAKLGKVKIGWKMFLQCIRHKICQAIGKTFLVKTFHYENHIL